MRKWLAFLLAAFLYVPIAQHKMPAPKEPPPKVLIQKGIASYYGGAFHGRLTASGTRFDKHKMTAASKTLPFGSLVEVVNLKNKRSVWVTITDRGPYVKHRVIDLSHAAALSIGITGVAPVAIYRRS